jgi:G3E family GTPase
MTPVTIVTGSLGAGKTTLLNHVLSSEPERRIGVLVNDFGDVNIDSRLIAGASGDVVSLANGCICCSMRNDVVQAVFRVLEHERPPEHLLVEASGVSNPGALAEIFLGLEKDRVLRVDGIVAVIDAELFPYDALKTEPLARDQVLASDLVVLNKADLADQKRLDDIEAAIRKRVPDARVLRASMAKVPAEVLLGMGGSRVEARHLEVADHGFETFTFSGGQLSFKRLAEVVRGFPPAVVRIKGIISVVERPGDRIALNVVGKRVFVETIGAQEEARSEIVVIGTRDGFDPAELSARLASCRL